MQNSKNHRLKKSVKSQNPWQSVIQTKMQKSESRINQITRKDTDELGMHLSESRMNRITRIARKNSKCNQVALKISEIP